MTDTLVYLEYRRAELAAELEESERRVKLASELLAFIEDEIEQRRATS